MQFRKKYYYDRENYTYQSVDGSKVVIHPGDSSSVDNIQVTKDMIRIVYSCEDAEVYNNLKNHRNRDGIWFPSLDAFSDADSDMDRSDLMREAAEHEEVGEQYSDEFWEVVDSMPGKTRTAFILYWIKGYSMSETADIMGCSKPNVSKCVKRAEEILKKKYHRG